MPAGEVTVLLQRLSSEKGDDRKRTYDELIEMVYEDLRRRAYAQVGREYQMQSIRATALVHEAYESMLAYDMPFESRQHFLNVAAKAMRRLLIDRARRLSAGKRGSGQDAEPLKEHHAVDSQDPDTLIALDAAMETLRPEQIRLVELRYFAGLTVEETAEAMGLEVETVKKRWQVTRVLLYNKLASRNPNANKR
ncbi:MAG: sigma-70 family RNA polymerase sigma factor [Acidobacteria bacterium]|nr:sigma-70 family RNA polymerase sigma factor [Acidobacteriota bacterium]